MESKVRVSKYYLPILKNVSSDAKLASHRYCLMAGLVKQCGAGMYTWLPLGLRVLQKIQNIVRQQLNKAGIIEVLMPCIQQSAIWKESGRYNDYGQEMLKIKDRHQNEILFGPTNEELITSVIKNSVNSYKQLPKIFYQIQWKFRDEIRPRFGLMRAREFLMKDAYSFDKDEHSAMLSYNKMYQVYLNVFKKLGVNVIPSRADAGAIGGQINHEFHIITKSDGEGKIFYEKSLLKLLKEFYKAETGNQEELDNTVKKLQNAHAVTQEALQKDIAQNDLEVANGIEVGHIFSFGKKYSKCMGASFANKEGLLENFCMGSYGIGISRLVAAIVEARHDELGAIWPKEVAPFSIGLTNLHKSSSYIADEIFDSFNDIIYDDTEENAGIKFARMDLVSAPIQIIVGKKSVENQTVEVKLRSNKERVTVKLSNLNEYLKNL